MCTQYRAPDEDPGLSELRISLGDLWRRTSWEQEVYTDYLAPIVRMRDDGAEALLANFGFWPKAMQRNARDRAKEEGRKVPPIRDTVNARAERIGESPLYGPSWRAGRRALIPAAWFYEPRYTPNDSSNERWRIGLASGAPCAIAGVWRTMQTSGGQTICTMAMITVNADDHRLLRQFHRNFDRVTKKPEEKRSVVIVRVRDYDDWLRCPTPEEARSFFTLLPADELHAEPAPKPKKA
ncbi:gp33 [Burkholderia pseudomallei]|nr:gp33 [Burkholderia pseudomallei]CAJ9750410.1 gp33 [Burkholderia pseudomallei]CPG85043.1 gp33 [Burkholderia pseudomallei]